MPIALEQYGIDQLAVEDRLELMGLLWDSLNAEQQLPSPAWHKQEVERRIARADAHQEAGIPLEVAIDKVLGNRKFDE